MRHFFISLFICMLCGFNLYSQPSSAVLRAGKWFDGEENFQEQNQSKNSLQKSGETADSAVLLNFHVVKRFSEEVPSLQMPYNISLTSRLTVIVVFHSRDTVSEHGIWSVTKDGKQVTGLTDKRLLRNKSEYAYPVKRRGIPLINTSMQAFSKMRGHAEGNHFSLGKAMLGDTTVSAFSGDIAECFVFDRFLKRQDALKIETYLAVKYGITLIASDYISPSEVVLWNYEENKAYSNGIAGLGKDSVFGLEQKQGSSSEEADLLTIGVGNYSTLNRYNDYALTEGNYLVWGHNSGLLEVSAINSQDAYPLIERKWLIQSTNTKNNSFSTWVKFRIPEQYRDSNSVCYLAIDRSGMGDFTSKSVEYLAQDGIDAEGYVYFNDVQWNVNGFGKEVFGFSYRMDIEEETDVEDDVLAELDKKTPDLDKDKGKKNKIDEVAKYQLYPSPSSGDYRLEAELPAEAPIYVRIYTMSGTLVKSWTDSGKKQYSFTDYIETQGVYSIEVETVYEKKVFKLAVIKK